MILHPFSYDIIEVRVGSFAVGLCEKNAPRHMPQGEDIEHRIMPLRTECDSTFLSFLKEISGINDRPLLRTDQKHARTKTVLGGAGQSSMFTS